MKDPSGLAAKDFTQHPHFHRNIAVISRRNFIFVRLHLQKAVDGGFNGAVTGPRNGSFLGLARKFNGDGRALAFTTPYVDRATMVSDDLVDDRQTEARPACP